ncbi:MAG TPA: substrate-binding domain-containing protein [Lacipirellulaceae bacterium]|nr:substrate-binding domain-containing protein [Lacipirellulaceae bacterium]HMP07374.1 substrate-binding domain-containing protein [Lacipirellulaceae bacterium]
MTRRTGLAGLSLLLSIAIGWAIASSGTSPGTPLTRDRKVTIGLSLGTLAEERWQRDRDYFVARAQEMGASVLVQSGNNDGLRQMQDIEALLSRGVDVLVIVAFNPAAMGKAVEIARAAGVPVICYDRMITDANVDLYISFDNVEVGRLQAQYLIDRLGGSGAIVRVLGPKTDHTSTQFKQGQDEVLEPYIRSGTVKILHEDYAESWKPENAKKIVNAAITAHGPTIDAVLATNDGTAGGAVQALLEEGLAGKVLVTGQDADLAACQRIARGWQSMSVYKPLSRLARTAAEAAFALGAGKPLIARAAVPNGLKDVPALLEPVVVVEKENLTETVVKDGFHRQEDLQ